MLPGVFIRLPAVPNKCFFHNGHRSANGWSHVRSTYKYHIKPGNTFSVKQLTRGLRGFLLPFLPNMLSGILPSQPHQHVSCYQLPRRRPLAAPCFHLKTLVHRRVRRCSEGIRVYQHANIRRCKGVECGGRWNACVALRDEASLSVPCADRPGVLNAINSVALWQRLGVWADNRRRRMSKPRQTLTTQPMRLQLLIWYKQARSPIWIVCHHWKIRAVPINQPSLHDYLRCRYSVDSSNAITPKMITAGHLIAFKVYWLDSCESCFTNESTPCSGFPRRPSPTERQLIPVAFVSEKWFEISCWRVKGLLHFLWAEGTSWFNAPVGAGPLSPTVTQRLRLSPAGPHGDAAPLWD